MAKCGAIAGSFMFTPIQAAFGSAAVMWVQVSIALLGMVVTHVFIPGETEFLGPDQEVVPRSFVFSSLESL
jgi:hypothetical protein